MTLSLDPSAYVNLREVEKMDISTLDGWKTFVRLRGAYQHMHVLSREEYESLTLDDRRKYDMLRRFANFNPPKQKTPMTMEIRAQVAPVLRANLLKMDPGVRSGIFISADGAAGKSTLVRELAADYEAEIEVVRGVMPQAMPHRDRWVPVAWVTVPPKLSIKSLASDILAFYGEPTPSQATESRLTKRVTDVIRDCGTRLLVLDDITRYKDGEADRQAADWVRNLMETSVTIIAMGVDVRGSGILDDGAWGSEKRKKTQTKRRFTVLDIAPFAYDTDDDVLDWVHHLEAIESDLPLLDKTPGMLSGDLPEFLFDGSEGVVGSLAEWVQLAADSVIGRALKHGGERLTRRDFERIKVKGAGPSRSSTTPATRSASGAKKAAGQRRGRNSAFDQPDRTGVA